MDSHSPGGAPQHTAPAWRDDVRIVFACLTRLPLPRPENLEPDSIPKALRLAPVVGAFVGAIAGSMYWLWLVFGLSPFLGGLMAVLSALLVTGAIHEKALHAMAESFAGSGQSGAFGPMALLFALLLRAGAIAEIGDPGGVFAALIAAGALSQAAMYVCFALLAQAGLPGIADGVRKPEQDQVLAACAIAMLICLISLPFTVALTTMFSAALGGAAMAKIGGRQRTAHASIAASVQQITEICALLVLTAQLTL